MDYIRELLSKVSEEIKEQGYRSTSVTGYNIFRILKMTEQEVIMCRFLADLLNPEGEHGCGILFLKSFLQNVLKETRVNDTLLMHTDVFREVMIDGARRIDLVIENARFLIPIEVKIYAKEQNGQCFDYYAYARQYDKDTQLVYLTRHGSLPSEYSRRSKDGTEIVSDDSIMCISWERDIYEWLDGVLPRLEDPVIKAVIMQYMEAIDSFTDRKDGRIMETCLDILYESADFFRAGIQIEKTVKAAKLKLIQLVLDDFKKEMEHIAPVYGLELEQEAKYYDYTERSYEEFYDRGSTYPGLNYIVKNAGFQNSSLQMWFRIEIEYSLYAGFVIFDREARTKDGQAKGREVDHITDKLAEEASRYLEKDIITPVDWWLAWCYSNGKRQEDYYTDVPDFMHMNPCAMELADNQMRLEFVRQAVRMFEEQLLKFLIHG